MLQIDLIALLRAGGKIMQEASLVKVGSTIIALMEDPDGYKIKLIENKIPPML